MFSSIGQGPSFYIPKERTMAGRPTRYHSIGREVAALLGQVDMLWSDFEKIPQFIEVPKRRASGEF